jgi:hypothetical protein
VRAVISLRSIVAVATLVVLTALAGVAISGHRPASQRLDDAIDRTLSAGTARVVARVSSPGRGPVEIRGVVSLLGPEEQLSATGAGEAGYELRRGADGAWIRRAGHDWTPAPAATAAGSQGTWASIIVELRTMTAVRFDVGSHTFRGRLGGRPVTVRLASDGRIRAIRTGTLAIDLRDPGADLPPPRP